LRKKSHAINPNGAPRRAAKTKEKPAGVTGGLDTDQPV
jgi:hypothetical protein